MGMIGLVIVGDDTSNKDTILAYDMEVEQQKTKRFL